MLAALYILSRAFPAGIENTLLLAGTGLVGFIAVCVLSDFQLAMERFRDRLANIYKDYFSEDERKRLGLDATSKHVFISIILYVAVVFAAGSRLGPSTKRRPSPQHRYRRVISDRENGPPA